MSRFVRRTALVGAAVTAILSVALLVAPMALASAPPTSVRVNNNTMVNIPDRGSADIPFVVSGASGVVDDVRVSFYLTNTWVGELRLSLVAPDSTTIRLRTENLGVSTDNYGTGTADDSRTMLTDAAAVAFTAGTHPFVGSFRPEAPLSTFDGKSPNGTWILRIEDMYGGDLTTFYAGSLFIGPSDITPPVITTPANTTVEATGPDGAAVSFNATALDAVDGAVTCYASQASGSTFPIGTTTVQLSARDAAGNWSYSSFTVTVVDTTAPTISAPADLYLPAASLSGAQLFFDASANDAVSGSTGVTFWLNYGMWNQSQIAAPYQFPHGTTTVTCVSGDSAGNTATSTFAVNVSWANGIQQVFDQLSSQMPTLRSSYDRTAVADAIASLKAALTGGMWIDGSHPRGTLGGEAVFGKCKAAVDSLRRCGAAGSQLRMYQQQLALICRGIAEMRMAESTQAGGNARKMSAARDAMARGDQNLGSNAATAIDYYKEAWKQALGAISTPQ